MLVFRTQGEKDAHEAKMREVYANMPKPEITSRPTPATTKPKNHKKRYTPPSGFKLGDVMPAELRAVGESYRAKRNRGKIYKSNNKGDQHYGKARRTNERTT